MTKSATAVMQDIISAAVLDVIGALKAASKGVPNTLLRDLNAIHANTTLADLPPEVQAAITASVQGAFTRLMKEGYSVASASAPPPPRRDVPPGERRPPPRRDGPGSRGPAPRRDGPGLRGPARGDSRPPRKPKPGGK